jgi:hypothetical protein
VEEIVERASGVEAGASLVAGGQPLRRVAARDLHHEVDVHVAEVVADPHSAQDHHLVVKLVELGVVPALLAGEVDVRVRQQRGRQLAWALRERAPAPVEGHQEPELHARVQVDPLVEEALLGRLEVLVVAPDAVLPDGDLHAAVRGREQRARQRAPGVVVPPFEGADQDAAPGLADPGQDAVKRRLAPGEELERCVGSRLQARRAGRQARQRHRVAESSLATPRPQSMADLIVDRFHRASRVIR